MVPHTNFEIDNKYAIAGCYNRIFVPWLLKMWNRSNVEGDNLRFALHWHTKIVPSFNNLIDHMYNDITNISVVNEHYLQACSIFPRNVGVDILNKMTHSRDILAKCWVYALHIQLKWSSSIYMHCLSYKILEYLWYFWIAIGQLGAQNWNNQIKISCLSMLNYYSICSTSTL